MNLYLDDATSSDEVYAVVGRLGKSLGYKRYNRYEDERLSRETREMRIIKYTRWDRKLTLLIMDHSDKGYVQIRVHEISYTGFTEDSVRLFNRAKTVLREAFPDSRLEVVKEPIIGESRYVEDQYK